MLDPVFKPYLITSPLIYGNKVQHKSEIRKDKL